MMKEKILNALTTECPWRDTLYWYDTIDSTNTRLKELARYGAVAGTVVLAGQQSAGRGRLGRSFHSPAGLGLYISVLLRPECRPEALMHLTCAAAVAVCDGIEKITGVRPGVKWINDLVLNRRKLGGILTELSVDSKTGLVDYAIVGIGINCRHDSHDFPQELQDIATSLHMEKLDADPASLAAAVITALQRMNSDLFCQKDRIMAQYRADCITLGQDVTICRFEDRKPGKALDVDEEGALVVQLPDGSVQHVNSGEISVRGLYSYI